MQERDPLPQLKKYVLDTGILTEQQVRPGAVLRAIATVVLGYVNTWPYLTSALTWQEAAWIAAASAG